MIEIRMYEDGDYEAIDDCVEPFAGHCDTSEMNEIGVHFTVTEDGKPIGTGGVVYITDDEGEVWLRLSKEFIAKPITMMRIVREGFGLVKECCGLRVVTAKVQEKFSEGKRLVERFGFRSDGKLISVFGFKYRIYKWVQQDY